MSTISFGINRDTGKEMHIDDATKKEKYVCAWCKQPLIVNDGPVMGKFFRHFRPDEDCILIKYGNGKLPFANEYNEPNDGIHQHFPEWMAYLRALKQGEEEKAATLWDFNLPEKVIEEKEIVIKEDVSIIEETKPVEQISFPLFQMEAVDFVEDEDMTNDLVTMSPLGDDLEWYSQQAMLKPIESGLVNHCPINYQTVPVDQCENCQYFMDIRQPTVNPDKPNVVVCRGHHLHV